MFKNSKLSRYKIGKIAECFCIDIDATKTALLLKFNRKTVNKYFLAFRTLIYAYQVSQWQKILGAAEVDGSSFDPARAGGHPSPQETGRGAFKQPVFGIHERNGSIYTELVSDGSAKALRAIVRGKTSLESVILPHGWRGYDGLIDVGCGKCFRINKINKLTEKHSRVNAIDAFWSFTTRRLSKFNGVKKNFELHLKECEWRYNKPLPQLLAELKRLCR